MNDRAGHARGAKDSGRLRVMFVIPGEASGSSMIFARRQAASLRRRGVEVLEFHLRSRTSLREIGSEFLRFERELGGFRPDVVHAQFGTVTGLFSVVAAGRIPVVVTFRGSDLNPSPGRWKKRARGALGRVFSQMAAAGAARVLCVSSQLRARLWWKAREAVILPSGVDPAVFAPRSREEARTLLAWPPDELVVLFNAGHDPAVKGLDLAERALESARRRWVGPRERAAAGSRMDGGHLDAGQIEGGQTEGSGEFRGGAALKPDIRLEKLDGSVAPERVPLLMNAADCLLLASHTEGSPTVVQEALASNLPVVSVEVGDVAQRLAGVRASCVVPRDAEALGEALAEVLRRRERSDGCRKLPEFSSAHIAQELERIYRGVKRSRDESPGRRATPPERTREETHEGAENETPREAQGVPWNIT